MSNIDQNRHNGPLCTYHPAATINNLQLILFQLYPQQVPHQVMLEQIPDFLSLHP